MSFMKRTFELKSLQFYLLIFLKSYSPFGMFRTISSLILELTPSQRYWAAFFAK